MKGAWKKRGGGKCRHRTCGCGTETWPTDEPGSFEDPCLQEKSPSSCWSFGVMGTKGIHHKSKPWVSQMRFTVELNDGPISMAYIKIYFV